MELTLIIPCRNDPHVFNCIGSIDEDVEIIVVLTVGSSMFLETALQRAGVKVVYAPVRAMGIGWNNAIDVATHDRLLFMSSDTWFGSGCIRKLYVALDSYKVVRATTVYEVGRLPWSYTIADVRDYINNHDRHWWVPGLALRRDLLCEVGGYFFDRRIWWTEDDDLDVRIRSSNVDGLFLTDARIYHSSVSLLLELRSNFWYGRGDQLRYNLLGYSVGTYFHGYPRKLERLRSVVRAKGPLTALAMIMLDVVLAIGRLYQRIRPLPPYI